jgi:hypothetical protein
VDDAFLEAAILGLADSVYLTATLLPRYVDETAPIYGMIGLDFQSIEALTASR